MNGIGKIHRQKTVPKLNYPQLISEKKATQTYNNFDHQPLYSPQKYY